jgi:hypothetical protein
LNILKQLGQSFIQVVKRVADFPKIIALAAKDRELRRVSNKQEAERLDRIRNPSKYRGKEI